MKICPGCNKPTDDFWKITRLCKECEYTKRRGRGRELARLKILAALTMLGGCCVCCGETTLEFLTFDHMDGRGGTAHEKLNNYSVASRVLKGDKDIRVLCMNCNHSYGMRGYCPHRPFGRYGIYVVVGVRRKSYVKTGYSSN